MLDVEREILRRKLNAVVSELDKATQVGATEDGFIHDILAGMAIVAAHEQVEGYLAAVRTEMPTMREKLKEQARAEGE